MCPKLNLKVPSLVWLVLPNVGKFKVLKFLKFYFRLTLYQLGLDFRFGTWNRFVLSFGTCLQNSVSFELV